MYGRIAVAIQPEVNGAELAVYLTLARPGRVRGVGSKVNPIDIDGLGVAVHQFECRDRPRVAARDEDACIDSHRPHCYGVGTHHRDRTWGIDKGVDRPVVIRGHLQPMQGHSEGKRGAVRRVLGEGRRQIETVDLRRQRSADSTELPLVPGKGELADPRLGRGTTPGPVSAVPIENERVYVQRIRRTRVEDRQDLKYVLAVTVTRDVNRQRIESALAGSDCCNAGRRQNDLAGDEAVHDIDTERIERVGTRYGRAVACFNVEIGQYK